MKKNIALVLAILILVVSMQPIQAGTRETTLIMNGKVVKLAEAFVENGRTLVPAEIFTQLGATVTIKGDTILVEGDYSTVELKIGSTLALIHHKFDFSGIPAQVQMDVVAKKLDETLFLPLRFVAEAIDAKVIYNEMTKVITILKEEELKQPLEFTVIDTTVVRMTQELGEWFYADQQVKGIDYKVIGDGTYIKIQAGMKPTGGYGIGVNGVYDLGSGTLYIDTNVLAPNAEDMVTQVLTYPFLLIHINDKIDTQQVIGEIK